MEFKDYYQILGVSKDASQKDIKAAFRRLARKHHPDVNPGDKAAEDRFKEINEANEVLSHPEKRKKYDELGANWKEYEAYQRSTAGASTGPAGGQYQQRTVSAEDLRDMFGEESPFSDFFTTFFGGGGRPFGDALVFGSHGRSLRRRGGDLEQGVEITLDEAFSGTTRAVRIQDPSGQRRQIEITIPPGIRDGQRVRAAGQGEPGEGGAPAGDLYLRISLRPHRVFERRGDDLHAKLHVPLTTCVLGGEVDAPTMKGKLVLRIPPETQDGRTFRLRGQGMPRSGQGERGDLYVEVHALLPQQLGERERRLFEELAQVEPAAQGAA